MWEGEYMKKLLIITLTSVLMFAMLAPVHAEEKEGTNIEVGETVGILEPTENMESDNEDIINESLTNDQINEKVVSQPMSNKANTLVPDPIFKKIINKELYKSSNYEPTVKDLESITFLDLTSTGYSDIAYINDITGLEKMKNLETIYITNSFIPENTFAVLATLPKLTEVFVLGSYTSGDQSTVNIRGKMINGSYLGTVVSVPFNYDMNIGDLGKNKSIETIYVGTSQVSWESGLYENKGMLNLKGLENMKSLKSLQIASFADVDDKEMNFLKGLDNLEQLELTDIPFTNGDSVLELKKLNKLTLNNTEILDFSKLQYAPALSKTVRNSLINIEPQSYINTKNGVEATIDTGIIIPDNATNVEVKMDSYGKLESYEIIENRLFITVSSYEFSEYDLWDWKTSTNVSTTKGFRFSVSYTTETSKQIVYWYNLAQLDEHVYFNLGDVDSEINVIKINIEDKKIEVPTEADFGLMGYTIEGWYTDPELNNKANLDKKFLENTMLYAKLKKKYIKYSVFFDTDGGSQIEPLNRVKEGSIISAPDIPVKEGFVFMGWFSDSEYQTEWNFESNTIQSNTVLYALWNPETLDPILPIEPEIPVEPINPVDPVSPTKPVTTTELPDTGLSMNYLYIASALIICGSVMMAVRKKQQKD